MHNGLNEIQPVFCAEAEQHSTKISKNVIFKMTSFEIFVLCCSASVQKTG